MQSWEFASQSELQVRLRCGRRQTQASKDCHKVSSEPHFQAKFSIMAARLFSLF